MFHVQFVSLGFDSLQFAILITVAVLGMLTGNRTVRVISAIFAGFLYLMWDPTPGLYIAIIAAVAIVFDELSRFLLRKTKEHISRLISRPFPLIVTIVLGIVAGLLISR